LGERLLCTQEGVGSIPIASTPHVISDHVLWILLVLACAADMARTGLVTTSGLGVSVTTPAGKTTRLVLEGDARAIARLQGCVVDLRGQRVVGGLRVGAWSVRDAGFGSQPFVGTMRRTLTGWVLDDRTTGSVLRIADVGPNEPVHGSMVLINGLVVGYHELQPISVRTLLDPSEAAQTAPDR
jgi:hypothetical protein